MTHVNTNNEKTNKDNKTVFLEKENKNENSKEKLKETVVVNMNFDEGIIF